VTITVTGKDADGQTATGSFDLTVVALPTITATPAATTLDATTSTTFTYSMNNGVGPLTNVTASATTGAATVSLGTSNTVTVGATTDPLTITVTGKDADGQTATGSFDLTVVAVPTISVSTVPSYLDLNQTSGTITVTTTGTGVTGLTGHSSATGVVSVSGSNGSYTVTANGYGSATITFTAMDAAGNQITSTPYTVMVQPLVLTLGATLLTADTAIASTPLNYTVSGGVGTLTVTSSYTPVTKNVSMTINQYNGYLTVTPASTSAIGTATLTVTVKDANNVTLTKTATVSVQTFGVVTQLQFANTTTPYINTSMANQAITAGSPAGPVKVIAEDVYGRTVTSAVTYITLTATGTPTTPPGGPFTLSGSATDTTSPQRVSSGVDSFASLTINKDGNYKLTANATTSTGGPVSGITPASSSFAIAGTTLSTSVASGVAVATSAPTPILLVGDAALGTLPGVTYKFQVTQTAGTPAVPVWAPAAITTNSITWNATPGKFTIQLIETDAAGHTSSAAIQNFIVCTPSLTSATGVSLTASLASPQTYKSGISIPLTANVTSGTGSGVHYVITCTNSTGVQTTILNGLTQNAVNWKPTAAGTYTLTVTATDQLSSLVATSTLIYTLN
jgi:hypothetical protein